MTIKIFTDPAMTTDAYPSMRVDEDRFEIRDGHAFAITATAEFGCDTGRRRYRVHCRSCDVVVHPATTGPRSMMETHVKWFEEDGKATPWPGTKGATEQ
jgi:hypothetical protein